MRWAKIKWKPNATSQDKINCMAFILGVDDPPMPSEFFINDVWTDDRDRDLIQFDRLTDALAQRLAAIPSDGKGWHFKIGACEGGPSWQGNINQDTAVRALAAIEKGL